MTHSQSLLTETSGAARRPKLLVVDDQAVNIQALYQVFCADHQVFMATSGAQALALCRDKQPDLVLLDVVMPEMDGYEVCARLKADDQTHAIPVIFVTASHDELAETRGLDVGAVDFISKPFNARVVRARVKTHLTLKAQSDLLRELVFIDGLTGAHNRRCFDEHLAAEWGRAMRNGATFSVLMIDVDHFKQYNDRYGHQAGDDCLRRVASALKVAIRRPGDLLARYGGEEFAVILPDTALDGALTVAGQLEQCVRALAITHADSLAASVVTVSIGAASRPPTAAGPVAALLGLADAQLYAAKSAGRARVQGAQLCVELV